MKKEIKKLTDELKAANELSELHRFTIEELIKDKIVIGVRLEKRTKELEKSKEFWEIKYIESCEDKRKMRIEIQDTKREMRKIKEMHQ